MENLSFFKRNNSFFLLALILGSLSPVATRTATAPTASPSYYDAFRSSYVKGAAIILVAHAARLQFIDHNNKMTKEEFNQKFNEAWNNGQYLELARLLACGYDDFITGGCFARVWPAIVASLAAVDTIQKGYGAFFKLEGFLNPSGIQQVQ